MANRFGEIVVDLGFVTPAQIQEAIELQKSGRAKLGQIMIKLKMLSENQVDEILSFQVSDKGMGKRFGDCALELNFITGGKLAEAVRYQTTSKGVFGDILVELGYLTEVQRDEAVKRQMEI